MSKNYDLIATVGIDITSPIVDTASFDNLLIVGPLPATAPATAPPLVGEYASIDEVEAAGWDVSGADADPVGIAAAVAFSQNPTPKKIFIAPIQVADETPETAVTTVQRAVGTDGWYVVCTAGVADNQLGDIATYIETQEKMFCYTDLAYFASVDGNGIGTPVVGSSFYRTMGIFGKESSAQVVGDVPAENKFLNVAWVAKWLFYQAGTETAAFKALNTVKPSSLTSAEMAALKTSHMNYFVTVGGKNISMNGMVMAGEWADVIRFRDWLKNDMQVRVVDLFTALPKIPFTDAGIALVQNKMIASLKAGQDIGGIAPEEFDADGTAIPGYTTNVPAASSFTASQKASRQLTGLTFKARLSGAIHFADINGSLTVEL